MNCRWMGGLIALACLTMVEVGAVSPAEDPVADRFSFPVGAIPNSPNTSRYQGPDGRSHTGWAVHPAASFLSPGYGRELQPGEDWGGRGGGDTDLGQPVYAAAAGTIVATTTVAVSTTTGASVQSVATTLTETANQTAGVSVNATAVTNAANTSIQQGNTATTTTAIVEVQSGGASSINVDIVETPVTTPITPVNPDISVSPAGS